MLLPSIVSPEPHRRVIDAAAVSALLGSSWAITEQGRQQVIAAAVFALQARDPLPLNGTRRATVREGGVAVIPVSGVLFTKDAWWGSDYETILKDLTAALDNREVKAIVLDVDSIGGLVSGCHEASAAIFAARKKKPVVAYVGGSCASAAYWLTSAAERIVASPTALVGSIGCFATLVDDTEMLAKLGLKIFDVANDQSPHKILDPSKPADRDRARVIVTQQASVFIADVATGRGVSTDRVEARVGKGDQLVGIAAVEAGLADKIGDFESLIAELAATKPTNDGTAARAPALRVVKPTPPKKSKPTRAVTVRAERKPDMALPDLDKLKEHATSLHDAIHSESEAEAACEAAAPHMKALHAEMGDYSPFKKKDDDDDDDAEGAEAKALVRELGGVKAARGEIAAMKKMASRVTALEKQVTQATADKAAAELKAMLDEATVDGRIAPSDRAEMEKLHADAGMRACLSRLPKKPQAAREIAGPTATAPTTEAPAAPVRLSAEEAVIAKALGLKPEAFAQHKAHYNHALGAAKAAEADKGQE